MAQEQAARWSGPEPRLDELLDDPVCQLMMRRDGITPQAIWSLVDQLRTQIRGSH